MNVSRKNLDRSLAGVVALVLQLGLFLFVITGLLFAAVLAVSERVTNTSTEFLAEETEVR